MCDVIIVPGLSSFHTKVKIVESSFHTKVKIGSARLG